MGKRQVGELQLSELVCAIFISELATAPIGDKSIPLLYGIVPILFLVSSEVIISYLSIKFSPVKRAFDYAPDFLINDGKFNQQALKKSRVTVEELMSELRQQGTGTFGEIRYAILEANGKISVIKKDSEGLDRALIIDGKINDNALRNCNKNEKWIDKTIKTLGFKNTEEVFLLTLSDNGEIYSVKKEK
jgi:uncharacterized membrane protein YcaP (DUF421 family)